MGSSTIAGIEAIEPIEATRPVGTFGGRSASFERILQRAVDGGLGRGIGIGSTSAEVGLPLAGSPAVVESYNPEMAALWVGRTPEHSVALAGIMAHANGIHRLDRSMSEKEPFSGTGPGWEQRSEAAGSHHAGSLKQMTSRTRFQQGRIQGLTARLLAGLGQGGVGTEAAQLSDPVDIEEIRRYSDGTRDGCVDADCPEGAARWGYGGTGSLPEQVCLWARQCAEELEEAFERSLNEGLSDLDSLLELNPLRAPMREGGYGPDAAKVEGRYLSSGTDHMGALVQQLGRILNGYLERDGRLRAFSLSDLGGNRLTRSSRSIPGSMVGAALDLSVGPNAVQEHTSALMLARVGISGWERVAGGQGRAAFIEAGVDPDQRVGDGTFLLVGSPDGSAFELSVPCHVRGRRYGAVVAEFLAS